MPKRTIPPAPLQISNTKHKDKEYKLTDGWGALSTGNSQRRQAVAT